MKPIVQVSLDFIDLDEALETARIALQAGVDWLEAGTPLVLAVGARGVRTLADAFPGIPLVADLKIMDGGYGETILMADAGATHVVVMSRSHPETVKEVVRAGRERGVKVMGDTLGEADKVEAAQRLEALGCDIIVHHIGFDERRGIARSGVTAPTPLDDLRAVVAAVSLPVQAVGGLSIEQASATPEYGAPLVVLGAPLVVPGAAASGKLEAALRAVCERVHAMG